MAANPVFKLLKPLIPFFIGLGVALIAGILLPQFGASGGLLRTEITTKWAVALIFFIQGLQLPSNELRQGLMAWPLHLFSQTWIFILTPLLVVGWVWICGAWIPKDLHVGMLYIGLLPTTIATSAAFTAQAKGNTAGILFNVCISNFLGLFIAPLWLAWLLATRSAVEPDLGPMFTTILSQLLLPFVIGQCVRFWVPMREWAKQHKGLLSQLTTWGIFYIVYAAICNFREQPATETAGISVPAAMVWTIGMLLVIQALCLFHLRFYHWPVQWKSAAFFGGTQKSMAGGLPMAGAVMTGLENAPPLAVVVLPLMIYQISQMVLGAFFIPLLSPREAEPGEKRG